MPYTPQQWQNNISGTGDPGAVNAARLTHMEAGISAAHVTADAAASIAYNVLSYGAYGDGVHDDTAAIQAAIDAVPQADPDWGGTIYFPPGRYKCNSSLYIGGKAGIKFMGAWGLSSYEGSSFGDFGSYLITGTPGMTLFVAWGAYGFLGSPTGRLTANLWHYGQIFEGLTLQDAAGGSTLVDSVATNRNKFIRCSFRDATVGVNLLRNNLDSSWHRFDDCIFHDCDTGVYTDSYHTYFSGGEIFNCGVGIDILPAASNIHFSGTKADLGNPCFRVRGSYCSWTGVGWETTDSAGTYKGWDINGDASNANSGHGNKLIACHANGAGGGNNNSWSIGSLAYATEIDATYAFCTAPTNSGILTNYSGTGDGSLGAVTVRESSASYIQKWKIRAGSEFDEFEVNNGYLLVRGVCQIIAGNGSPAGAVSAPVGSLYMRADGGANTTLYVKESGTGTSGWVAK